MSAAKKIISCFIKGMDGTSREKNILYHENIAST